MASCACVKNFEIRLLSYENLSLVCEQPRQMQSSLSNKAVCAGWTPLRHRDCSPKSGESSESGGAGNGDDDGAGEGDGDAAAGDGEADGDGDTPAACRAAISCSGQYSAVAQQRPGSEFDSCCCMLKLVRHMDMPAIIRRYYCCRAFTQESRAWFSLEQASLLLPAKKLTISPAAPVRPLSPPQLLLRKRRPGQAYCALRSAGRQPGPMLDDSTVGKMPSASLRWVG